MEAKSYLVTTHALLYTGPKGQVVTMVLFYATDDEAAGKVARAYVRTAVAASRNTQEVLHKDKFRLVRHPVDSRKPRK